VRRLLVCALAAIAVGTPVALGAGGKAFKPIHVSSDWSYSALYTDNGGCAVFGLNAVGSALTIHFGGLEKPSSADYGQTVTYDLKGTVAGQITDANGRTFAVSGTFFDRTTATNRGDLRFDGTGKITLSGSAGTLSGSGTLRLVSAPNEVQLHLSAIRTCSPA
jgi:hypothetical protein